MKGVLDFLEKAGLVKQESPSVADERLISATEAATPAAVAAAQTDRESISEIAINRPSGAPALNLAELYAEVGVPASLYPAERLLRLVDGLSAMDETTRNLAIKAMDEADESWTIADPLRDAEAKLTALADHGAKIQQGLQMLEAETQEQIAAIRERQALRVGEIKKQMNELEALQAREVARGDSECSTREARLGEARNQVVSILNEIERTSRGLRRLSEQFGQAAERPTSPIHN